MNIVKALFLSGMAVIGLGGPAVSQSLPSTSPAAAAPARTSQPTTTELSASQRATIARDLISRWQPTVLKRADGGGARWASMLTAAIAAADPSNVLRATTATSLDQLYDMLNGNIPDTPIRSPNVIGNSTVAPQVLGSVTGDTVYTPLPYGRCRVADSRVINSAIPATATRNFWLENTDGYVFQGGSGTYANGPSSASCGMPLYATAYAVSVTLLSPTANGVFKVFPYGGSPQTGNSILFNAGDSGANGDLIVRNCRGCAYELSISSSASIHYVIDVIGYFIPPQATPLQCYYTTAIRHNVLNGMIYDVFAAGCAAGYTPQDTVCQGGHFGLQYVHIGMGQCTGRNSSGVTSWVQSLRQCCRVPGR